MQAIIFTIRLKTKDDQCLSLIGKRVIPSELPPKANMQMWVSFAESVRREIDFYGLIEKEEKIKHLYPRCYFADFNLVK